MAHHKMAIAAAAPFALDKGFDLLKEHFFLLAHDWITQAGLAWASVGGGTTIALLAIAGLHLRKRWCARHSGRCETT